MVENESCVMGVPGSEHDLVQIARQHDAAEGECQSQEPRASWLRTYSATLAITTLTAFVSTAHLKELVSYKHHEHFER